MLPIYCGMLQIDMSKCHPAAESTCKVTVRQVMAAEGVGGSWVVGLGQLTNMTNKSSVDMVSTGDGQQSLRII